MSAVFGDRNLVSCAGLDPGLLDSITESHQATLTPIIHASS